jgi:hypothetical protein
VDRVGDGQELRERLPGWMLARETLEVFANQRVDRRVHFKGTHAGLV